MKALQIVLLQTFVQKLGKQSAGQEFKAVPHLSVLFPKRAGVHGNIAALIPCKQGPVGIRHTADMLLRFFT